MMTRFPESAKACVPDTNVPDDHDPAEAAEGPTPAADSVQAMDVDSTDNAGEPSAVASDAAASSHA